MVWASGALSHLDLWGTAVVAAVSSVLVNNLQTASLLAACTPRSPLRAVDRPESRAGRVRHRVSGLAPVAASARNAGAQPSIARPGCIGAAVPLSMAAALTMLALTGTS